MFLLRLIHLSGSKLEDEILNDKNKPNIQKSNIQENSPSQIIKKETINQIKNVAQEKKIKSEPQIVTEVSKEISIKSFNELVELCSEKKEIKLRYELEKNVNLVKFENGRIEISFNDNLDKDFVKNLSTKLLEWTNQRWIISFSKQQGNVSIKEQEKNKQNQLIENTKKSELFKKVLSYFSDAELIDVKPLKMDDEK